LCPSYLLIFGLSSLNYNHHFGKPSERRHLLGAADRADQRLGERPRFSPERSGTPSVSSAGPFLGRPAATRADNLHFDLSRSGKKYTIHVLFEEELVRVEERRTGHLSSTDQAPPFRRSSSVSAAEKPALPGSI
ncbi:MAG: hypothetical protein VX911_08610, partial [Candidatus Latescibacterota bacterium]|nr:hypothetical protein [Candidatus Latescibacterota bacterium]